MLDASFSATMTDNSDGTYSYSTTIARPGKITVSVFRYAPGGAQFEYYANSGWSGLPDLIQTEPEINFSWGSGVIFGTWGGASSIRIYFRVKAPITGTVTFYLQGDYVTNLEIEGVFIANSRYNVVPGDVDMVAGQFYEGFIDWYDLSNDAYIYLSWSYTGQTQIIIPQSSLYSPTHINSPMQITIG